LVRVQSAPWANELSYLRAQLLARLQATPGGEGVTELRFTIGPLDELPVFDEAEPRLPPAPPPNPPHVDDGQVAAALLQVKDPELRVALAELFARERARR